MFIQRGVRYMMVATVYASRSPVLYARGCVRQSLLSTLR